MAPASRVLPALPPLHPWAAPDEWRRIDFISDLHLSAALPRTFDAFAAHLQHTPADAVVILGDLFEWWVGDDQRVRAFEAGCLRVLADSAGRRTMAFMAGNRDFLLGEAMCRDCGLLALPDPTLLEAWGRRLLLTHGDALCLDDEPYQRFRAIARQVEWQRAFLARPLDQRLKLATEARQQSDARRHGGDFDTAQWADVDRDAAVAWLRAGDSTEMIHGHTHRPGSESIAPGFSRHVLSDWDLDHAPARAEVLQLTRDGLARVAPCARP